MYALARKLTAAAVSLSSLSFATHALGDGRDFAYYERKDQGWFFYNDPKPPRPEPIAEEPPPPPPPPPPSAEAKPAPFSVEWLRKKMPIMLDAAINDPSVDNVSAYMYAQRMMLDMTDGFASQGQKVVQSDPYLNEEYRMPAATFAKRSSLFAVAKAKREVLADLTQRAGLWFFFDSKCAFCSAQFETLQRVARSTGFVVKNISLDGRPLPGMNAFVTDAGRKVFARMNLAVTPAVVLVHPPDKFLVVAHGAMAEDALLDKIVLAAADQQLVPKELTDVVQLEKRGILTPQDMAAIRRDDTDSDDPKVLVKLMQRAIQGRLQ
ncbi:conjugal transfer protein TraF [Burkholderia sp. MBR-1]|uniref:conjugal transfer protein TraF n=1 Tax=Burkholderia sp. MBR-1 TaxID=2732364 RepID=UPI0015EED1F4|nr:conjugal transfer protein TraF [Burkholderia sp. MBR-1]QMI49761.1 conjugal transfer protein TraF [Burkholderia sp. MBR-1]